MEVLLESFSEISWKQVVMWLIGGLLIFLAIKKNMEPSLLLPMGFGTILVNLPNVDAIKEGGVLRVLFDSGIANELFPLILFIGIGAMIDFGPLLSNPKLMIFGAAAQFGIFMTLVVARLFGFNINVAASTSVIAAADGPTAIVIAQELLGSIEAYSGYLGAIIVAAYSYMALVPIIQPPVIKLLTTKKERLIRMPYKAQNVSKATRILFPIFITVIAGLVAPKSASLVGFLMFGNLIRECGVLDSLFGDCAEGAGESHYHFPWHHRCGPDDSGGFLELDDACDPGTWSFRLYLRYLRRCDGSQVHESVPEGKNQSHDRRCRNFRISNVGACGP